MRVDAGDSDRLRFVLPYRGTSRLRQLRGFRGTRIPLRRVSQVRASGRTGVGGGLLRSAPDQRSPERTDHVGLTIGCPEYQNLLGSLKRFVAGEGHRVI